MLAMAQTGCARSQPEPLFPASGEAQPKHIAVVPARFTPESNFNTFAKSRPAGAGKGALVGAGIGALADLRLAGEGCHGDDSGVCSAFVLLLLPFFVAGGVVIGTATGTAKAVPAATAREIDATVHDALFRLKIQETLAEHVASSARAGTDDVFRVLEGHGAGSPSDEPAYGYLQRKGFDAVVEVTVTSLGFEGGHGSDPDLALFMNAKAKIIRLRDGVQVHAESYEYKGTKRPFTAWVAHDAKLLKDEFENCYLTLAQRIAAPLRCSSLRAGRRRAGCQTVGS